MQNDDLLDHTPPTDERAEVAILGAALMDGRFGEECDGLTLDDFSVPGRQTIYRRMREMEAEGLRLEIGILLHRLTAHREVQAVGGEAYISELTSHVVQRSSVRNYVAIVQEMRARRQFILACDLARERAYDLGTGFQEVTEAHHRAILDVSADTGGARDLAVPAREFLARMKPDRQWLVDGLIERGSNGFVVAEPKGSKSYWTVALADCLARGDDFLGFRVPQRVRVLVLNAEDNPETTRWRLSNLERHKGYADELDGWLWVTTKEEFQSMKLDRPSDVRDIVATCRKHKIEFLILDVLNVLHDADENDNKDMRRVLSAVNTIQAKAGCQICIVHHYNKADGQSITKRMRGSSAISGFAEWIVGLDVAQEEPKIRRAQFELKGGEAPSPIYYRIVNPEAGGVRFESCDEPSSSQPVQRERRGAASAL